MSKNTTRKVELGISAVINDRNGFVTADSLDMKSIFPKGCDQTLALTLMLAEAMTRSAKFTAVVLKASASAEEWWAKQS